MKQLLSHKENVNPNNPKIVHFSLNSFNSLPEWFEKLMCVGICESGERLTCFLSVALRDLAV